MQSPNSGLADLQSTLDSMLNDSMHSPNSTGLFASQNAGPTSFNDLLVVFNRFCAVVFTVQAWADVFRRNNFYTHTYIVTFCT